MVRSSSSRIEAAAFPLRATRLAGFFRQEIEPMAIPSVQGKPAPVSSTLVDLPIASR
jgi:hypothetical protein